MATGREPLPSYAPTTQNRGRPIELGPGESFLIYGWKPRPLLDWNYVCSTPSLNYESLINNKGISAHRLRTMQPSLATWINADRISATTVMQETGWALDASQELPRLTLMDCLQYALCGTPQRMCEINLNYEMLRAKFKMDGSHMPSFRYSLQAWTDMGFDVILHGDDLDDGLFFNVFGISKSVAAQTQKGMKQVRDNLASLTTPVCHQTNVTPFPSDPSPAGVVRAKTPGARMKMPI